MEPDSSQHISLPQLQFSDIVPFSATCFPGSVSGKEPACQGRRCKRCRFESWVGKILWRRKWQPTPVFLLGKFHGQRSLAGYSPRGHKESDTTEVIGIRKNEILLFAATWLDLESIRLSEISQTEKDKYGMTSCTRGT